MASIQKRTGPRGTTYQVKWREPDTGAQRSRTFNTEKEARQHRNKVDRDIDTSEYITTDQAKITVREYGEHWRLNEVAHRPGTMETVESRLRNHVYPTFGHRPIAGPLQVRRTEVQAWIKRLEAKGVAPASVAVIYSFLASLYKAAVLNGLTARTPCVGIKLPKVERERVEAPAVADVEAIWAATPARYRAVLTVAAGSGMRLGELLGLTVDRVDFLRRTISVDRQATNTGQGPIVLVGYTKTAAGRRIIPVDEHVLAALAAHIAAYGTGMITTDKGKTVDGLIFHNYTGQPIRRSSWGSIWTTARATASVNLRGVHQLRHLYASALIRAGVDAKTLQVRLGHKSITETYDTYGHMWPDDDDRTREALAATLGPRFLVAD